MNTTTGLIMKTRKNGHIITTDARDMAKSFKHIYKANEVKEKLSTIRPDLKVRVLAGLDYCLEVY